jgi:hypothetical protein
VDPRQSETHITWSTYLDLVVLLVLAAERYKGTRDVVGCGRAGDRGQNIKWRTKNEEGEEEAAFCVNELLALISLITNNSS